MVSQRNERGLVVDLFAGGGGASLGLERAGFPPDLAVNHDPTAIAMHRANHPNCKHITCNIYEVDPVKATGGRPVYILWASPDCKHFSKAKGSALKDRNIRALAWTVWKWARRVKPRIICVENVEEFQEWGPLIDGKPDESRKGLTFRSWVNAFRRLGYVIEWREMKACDYGAPTSRKRFFLIARRDGQEIKWPEPTHGPGLIPHRTAAECIDFSLPCPSIFLTKKEAKRLGLNVKRPLAEKTMARIARGIKKFVLDNPNPFIIGIDHQSGNHVRPVDEPLSTITTKQRHALISPHYITYYGQKRENDFRGGSVEGPLPTQTTENRFALVEAFLARHFGQSVGSTLFDPAPTIMSNGGGKSALITAYMAQHNGGATGHGCDEPLSTITSRGTQQQLVTSNLLKLRGTCRHGQQLDLPFPTITAGGTHVGEVRSFLLKYYGTGEGQNIDDPIHTIRTKSMYGLVYVHGEPYQIIDIGMRMLTAEELFLAQGFPETYIIDPIINGKPLTKTDQVKLCGNSVPPQFVEALISANCVETDELRMAG